MPGLERSFGKDSFRYERQHQERPRNSCNEPSNLLPEWAGSYSTLGVFYYQTGQIEKAREVLESVQRKQCGWTGRKSNRRSFIQGPRKTAAAGNHPLVARQQLLQLALISSRTEVCKTPLRTNILNRQTSLSQRDASEVQAWGNVRQLTAADSSRLTLSCSRLLQPCGTPSGCGFSRTCLRLQPFPSASPTFANKAKITFQQDSTQTEREVLLRDHGHRRGMDRL